MKRIAKGLFAVLLAATAGCVGTPTDTPVFVTRTNGDPSTPGSGSLTFTQSQSNDMQTPASAVGGTGALAFAGSISTASGCWGVTVAQTQSGNDITVTVTATPSAVQSCPQILTFNNYQGTITGLSAGTYTLTVIHTVGGTATTALNTTVGVR